MSKTTEELLASKGGSTAETNGMGSSERGFRPSGVYQLKDESGKVVSEAIVLGHPLFGDAQAAAFERVGYKFVRPATPDEIKTLKVEPVAQDAHRADDIKGILARLDAAERRAEEAEKANAELKANLEGGEPEAVSEPEAPKEELPLAKDNYNEAELRAIAAAEGVELTDEHNTKQSIIDAIVAAREAKKG